MSTRNMAPKRDMGIIELMEMFPDEESAVKWVEETRWPDDRPCPHCRNIDTYRMKKSQPLPFRCRGCWRFFSVRSGTVMHRSHLPVRKWVFAVYLWMSSTKGVSSVQLSKILNISQPSAWFMCQRLREAFQSAGGIFGGTVEVDETYVGGRFRSLHYRQRQERRLLPHWGRMIVVGARERESGHVWDSVIPDTTTETLMGFVTTNGIESV